MLSAYHQHGEIGAHELTLRLPLHFRKQEDVRNLFNLFFWLLDVFFVKIKIK
jgi:hypothetical protein